jgi:hypothetical protein
MKDRDVEDKEATFPQYLVERLASPLAILPMFPSRLPIA